MRYCKTADFEQVYDYAVDILGIGWIGAVHLVVDIQVGDNWIEQAGGNQIELVEGNQIELVEGNQIEQVVGILKLDSLEQHSVVNNSD